ATTEREILATLETLSRGRTTISITHRMAVAAMADHVLVLQSGRLVQEGVPEELLQVGGLYQQLYEEQMGQALPAGGRRAMGVRVEHLRGIPLFSALGQDGLATLAGALTQERYGSGAEVVRQGEPGETLYIIMRGEVEVVVGAGGTKRRVNVLGAGDYFGEMALLRDEPRNATVRTVTPVQLLSLARFDFQELLEDAPAVRRTLEETIASRRAMLRELARAGAGVASLPA
ncbi:MAG: cyclic nucleotide-binding domain-containing protein, partial [Chloroflexota bacterium]